MDRNNEQTSDYIPSNLLLPSSWKDGTELRPFISLPLSSTAAQPTAQNHISGR